MKFIKEFKIFEGNEPPIEVGSKWMNKHGWGDVQDLFVTDDNDKKTVFTVVRVSNKGNKISYTIDYEGNTNPGKVFTQNRKGFLRDLKPRFKWDSNPVIGKRLVNEAYQKIKSPDTNSKWIKNGTDEVATVLGAGERLITYEFRGEKVHGTIAEFVKDFTEVVKPVIEPRKNMYADRLSGEDDIELDFNKSEYLEDEKALIGAYFITKDNEKSIEVMNIKEFASQTAVAMDGSTPYSVSFHKAILPKSQIEIISDVEGKEGFFYIKIPYWLYQTKKDDLSIKRVSAKKILDVRDIHYFNKEFMKWFKDPDTLKYFAISDPRSLSKATSYSKRNLDS